MENKNYKKYKLFEIAGHKALLIYINTEKIENYDSATNFISNTIHNISYLIKNCEPCWILHYFHNDYSKAILSIEPIEGLNGINSFSDIDRNQIKDLGVVMSVYEFLNKDIPDADNYESKYPNMESVLDNVFAKQGELLDLIDELDEKYPVKGYKWDCDLNADMYDRDHNPWYLTSSKIDYDANQRCDEALKKQLQCVDDKVHHYINITPSIRWCSFCGTIEVNKKPYHPENPHFLELSDLDELKQNFKQEED